jgi:hypothetical protein
MNITELVSAIDSEIAILQQVRALLAGQDGHTSRTVKPAKKRRVMSADARARIAAAQRKRWAKQKKAAQKAP